MTSPVDTSVKFLHSGMVGAPVLNGVVGAGVALLDACLVNGFGATALTSLNVTSGVAQANFSGTFPGTVGSVVLISGVTGSLTALNGEQKITEIGTGYIRFATAAANGAAAGSISMKMAPLGWSIPFTGTNLRAYRSADTTGNRFYLRVNDTNALDMRVVGYETMTAISTGTNLFPTNAQQSGGGYWPKCIVAGAGEIVSWFVIGNSKRFYFCCAAAESVGYSNGAYDVLNIMMFGEFKSLKSTADAYNTALFSAGSSGNFNASLAQRANGPMGASCAIARLHTNAVGARALDAWSFMTANSSDSGGASAPLGPANGVPNTLMLNNIWLAIDALTYGPRGLLPELFHCPQAIPNAFNILKGDFVPGNGPAAGRTLLAIPGSAIQTQSSDGTYRRATFFDITGPWQ